MTRDRENNQNRLTRPGLAVLCLATFVSVVHSAMSSIVLPDLKADFDVPDDNLTWFVTAFIMTFATGTVVYGRFADMVGTRRPLLAGITLFAAGSFATAAAPEFWPAVAGRAVMGMGATAIPALSIATIVRGTAEAGRGRALGATVASVGIGFSAGPLIGALLTDEFGWRGPLVATGAASVVTLAAAIAFVRDVPGQGARGFDLGGAVLFAVAISGALIALNRLPSDVDDRVGVVAAIVAVPAAIAFVLWITRRRQRFLEPRLVWRGRYLAFCSIGLLMQGMHFGTVVLMPLLWTRYHDLTFVEIGVHFMPGALALAFFGTTGGFIIERLGTRVPVVIGTWAASNGAIAMHIAGANWSDWQVAGMYGVIAGGYGLTNAALLHGATSALEEEDTGAGVGFYTLMFFFGGAIASAAVGAVLRAREFTSSAWQPLFEGMAPEFSDAFLVIAVMASVAFIIAVGLGAERREAQPAVDEFLLRETAGSSWIADRQKPIRRR